MNKYIIVEIDDEALELMRKNGDETKELIQCKDCKYYEPKEKYGYWFRDDRCVLLDKERHAADFCSEAERKEE